MPLLPEHTRHAWWADLRHGGLLISPALLDETFPDGAIEPAQKAYTRLRDSYTAFAVWIAKQGGIPDGQVPPLHTWLDAVLHDFLGHPNAQWLKGSHVPRELSVESTLRERLRPDRVLYLDSDRTKPALAVFVDRAKRVGMGRGRTSYSKLLEFLRGSGMKLGLLTNGSQFRLCYAGLDHDSFVEWDAENWFEQSELRRQLFGFYTLLGLCGVAPSDGLTFPLLAAVEASRTRQGELSSVLGEQARRAVEILVFELNRSAHGTHDLIESIQGGPAGVLISRERALDALYQAACRIIMRIVVVLYAEARGLLPRELESYNANYGIEGLFEQLRRAQTHEGPQALQERASGWPRMLSLFRLIYQGSAHQFLAIHEYGGVLFRPGNSTSPDPVLRGLAALEDPRLDISDAKVLQVLELLKIGSMKIKRGRGVSLAKGPVDFSELRTEYIGILYEGLLDYRLKSADSVVVFLNLGLQPVLPLDILEGMSDANLKDLLGKLGKEKGRMPSGDEGSEAQDQGDGRADEEASAEGDIETEEVEESESEPVLEEEIGEEAGEQTVNIEEDSAKDRAHQWALRAVEVAGLVKRPRGRNPDLYQNERDRQGAARRLVVRVVEKGELYLSLWGGTRKGSGTFYTKPQLAVPTVHRTLEPLVYSKDAEGKLVAREPEEILGIKVCDPSCGSASFLVAALNYLTEGLYRSLWQHGRFSKGTTEVQTLPFGLPSRGEIGEETIPVPVDDETFERETKTRLKRYVVERCIYGADANPMAVELARLSLWIETMDEHLPFGFLDHKIKRGNSLVGCWFDRYQDYPLGAWLREGGDKNHSNGVQYRREEWTRRIKAVLNERVKPEIVREVNARQPDVFAFIREGLVPENLHERAVEAFERLHSLPVSTPDGIEERERHYRENFVDNPEFAALREAFDTWCAVWFWPPDRLGPEAPTPDNFYRPTDETRQLVRELRDELKFFHWELEFPDVFLQGRMGFDAIVGNPPWDTLQPVSREFFSNYDPLYRTYGRIEAGEQQGRLFGSGAGIEREWLLYSSFFKSIANWVKLAGGPFGEPGPDTKGVRLARGSKESARLHGHWRARRATRKGWSDPAHPFRFQGSGKAYTYRLFLEQSHSLLRGNGKIGMIVPSGLYTDEGSTDLRGLFLDSCRWNVLFGFENRKKVFDIDSRFKFAAVVIEKGGRTRNLSAAFMRHELTDWQEAERFVTDYPAAQVKRFSPKSRSILEIRTKRDLEIIEKIYDGAVLLGDQSENGWQIHYRQGDFNMTSDSRLFPPRPKWEGEGYRADAYGRWLKGAWRPREAVKGDVRWRVGGQWVPLTPGVIPSVDGNQLIDEDDIDDTALPLYEGRMIGQFDFSQKGWVAGKGRSAIWREIPWSGKVVEPQYLMSLENAGNVIFDGAKITIMDVGSATNARTMYATVLARVPCGHSAPIMTTEGGDIARNLALAGIYNALVFDFTLRLRLGGLHLTWHYLEETALPRWATASRSPIYALALRVALPTCIYAPEWHFLEGRSDRAKLRTAGWSSLWALSSQERLRVRCVLDAIVAELYGLSFHDFAWILRSHSGDPKGFWRVDQDKPIELRHTTLSLAAFKDVKEMGLEAFCNIADPDLLAECGWQIPESLTISVGDDGIVEFDSKRGKTVSVRGRLGPRFLPWQLEQTPEESWAECELHARNLLGEEQFQRLMERARGEASHQATTERAESVTGGDGQPKLFATGDPNLFGDDDPALQKTRRS
jgi:hypothetical protein